MSENFQVRALLKLYNSELNDVDEVPNFEASLLNEERSLDKEVKEVMVLLRESILACKVSRFLVKISYISRS